MSNVINLGLGFNLFTLNSNSFKWARVFLINKSSSFLNCLTLVWPKTWNYMLLLDNPCLYIFTVHITYPSFCLSLFFHLLILVCHSIQCHCPSIFSFLFVILSFYLPMSSFRCVSKVPSNFG